MPRNIEIKAKVYNSDHLRLLVEKKADTPPQLIFQEDTFFYSPSGRLKLRVFGIDATDEMILEVAEKKSNVLL